MKMMPCWFMNASENWGECKNPVGGERNVQNDRSLRLHGKIGDCEQSNLGGKVHVLLQDDLPSSVLLNGIFVHCSEYRKHT